MPGDDGEVGGDEVGAAGDRTGAAVFEDGLHQRLAAAQDGEIGEAVDVADHIGEVAGGVLHTREDARVSLAEPRNEAVADRHHGDGRMW